MESPRKFNDCYFYYYSTCTKGDNCVFRHEPSALGCETMCSAWQQGKCMDKRCKLRHMELRKNRKQIPCYWENQPGGCRKKHCPFMHKNPDARTDGIAPSQPAPIQPAASVAPTGAEAAPLASGTSAACVEPLSAHPPHPLPLLWQHQHQQPRQVVLDSTILGVLPGVGRSPLPAPHAAHEQYALPIDPLVVNFDEESDNESAPSSTPTKQPPDDDGGRSKSHELALLERIQAEAAAFYRYDPAPAAAPRAAKYDRLSLDDLAGNKHPPAPTERRKSLDFKVLSLEEIRARKKAEAILQSTPITLNLSRKRKLSTQETVTSTGNKIIKVIRSNSIVYKKVDPNAPPPPADVTKPEQKQTEQVETRKRTLSEQTADIYNMQEDELVDDCHEFKRIKITCTVSKPRLIRNRHIGLEKGNGQLNELDTSNKTDESDSEVQIVSVDITENTSIDLSDSEVIEVAPSRLEPIDIDSSDDDDVTITSSDFPKNVPDVVASCRRKSDNADKDILKDIDSILNDNTDSVEEL